VHFVVEFYLCDSNYDFSWLIHTGYTYCYRYDNNLFRLGFHLQAVLTQGSPKIVMQNQVRELVRYIVREESRSMNKPLRLSCSTDIVKMLQFQVQSTFNSAYSSKNLSMD